MATLTNTMVNTPYNLSEKNIQPIYDAYQIIYKF